jgi:hypothetical protein
VAGTGGAPSHTISPEGGWCRRWPRFRPRSREVFPGFLPCLCLSSRNGCSRLSAQRSASPPVLSHRLRTGPPAFCDPARVAVCSEVVVVSPRGRSLGFTPTAQYVSPLLGGAYVTGSCRLTVPGVPDVTAETRRIDVCSPIRLLSKTVVQRRAGFEQAEPRSLLLAVDRARHPSFGRNTYPGRADDAPSGFAFSAPCWNAGPALVTVRGPPRPSTCQVMRPLRTHFRAPVPDPVVTPSPVPRRWIEREGSFEDPPGGLTGSCDRTVVRNRSG